MPKEFLVRESRVVHHGYVFDVFRDRFYHRPSGKIVSRDLVVHPGAVAIVPFVDRDHLLLLRQFRYAARGKLWEIPAGTLEIGEKPLLCAKRELEEETGFKARRLKRLDTFFSVPGISNEIMTLYRADGLLPGTKSLDQDEFISHRVFSVKQAIRMIHRGVIRDAKTIIGILWSSVF